MVVNNKFLPKAIRPNWFENLMIVCLIVFYAIFSLFAVNKAFKPQAGYPVDVYIGVLIFALVDFAKRKEEGNPE